MAYTYTLSQTAPNAVKTNKLTGGGGVVTTYDLLDGLARPVQTQSLAVGGGTVVKTTNYDDQGRTYFVDNDYWTSSVNPGTAFFTPTSENNVPSQVVTAYNAVGRALTTSLNGTGVLVSKTTNAYTGADRVDTVPPTGGTATSTFTNSLGQKSKLTQYLTGAISGTSQATTYGYDGAGRMTSMLDPAGNTWTWTFDLLGRRVGQKDPDSGTSSATYDLAGNMTSTTDARGQLVTTTYDELNRKTKMFSGDTLGPLLASWTYDTVKKGLVTDSTAYTDSGSGALGIPGTPGKAYKTTVESYDVAGNPTKTTVTLPSDAPAFAGTSYSTTLYYKPDSSLWAKTLPAIGGLPSETVLNSYDSWGHLSGVSGYTAVLANTTFSPIGQLAQFNRYNGANSGYSTYGYDGATGEVLQITDNAVFGGTGHYVADRSYTRDGIGNVTSSTVNSVLPTAGTQKTCYTYDGLRELTRAWTPNASSTCATTPSAGAMGGIAPMWNDYTYDSKTGNRTGLTYHSSTGVASNVSYTYPAAGAARPHAPGTVTGPVDLGSGSYSHDAAGNQTGRPGQTLTFNEVGKVSKIVTGSTTQTNIYNPDGSLLLRVSNAEGAALFLGDTTVAQPAGSTITSGARTYTGAGGKAIAQRSATTGVAGTTLTWQFTGLDGTVDTQTVASSGATTRQYRDPFGVSIGGATGVWGDGTGFLGKPVTASSKLTIVGARTYDLVLGKFLSVDPVTDPSNPQQNFGYAYASNNPSTLSDPSGLKPLGRTDNGDWLKPGTIKDAGDLWKPGDYLPSSMMDPKDPKYTTTRYWESKLNPSARYNSLVSDGVIQSIFPYRIDYLESLLSRSADKPFSKVSTPNPISRYSELRWIQPDRPGWGALWENPTAVGPVAPVTSITFGGCALLCLSYGRGLQDGSNTVSASFGPEIKFTGQVGTSISSVSGFSVVGTCSATAGVGGYASVAIGGLDVSQTNGAQGLGTGAETGVSYGGGVGCSVGGALTWK